MTIEKFSNVRVHGENHGHYNKQNFVDQFGVPFVGTIDSATDYYRQQYPNCAIIVTTKADV